MIRVGKTWIKFKILKWFIAVLGLLLSIFLSLNYYNSQIENLRNHNNVRTERFLNKIEVRLRIYETLLSQTQAYFITVKKVSHKDFQLYYKNLRNLSHFYGIKGIGYSRYVTKEKLPAFLKEMRKEIPDFEIWPKEDKEEYIPVVYLEPHTFFNPSVIGLDQSAETNRLNALNRAYATGETTMSAKIHFMLSKSFEEKELGFLLIRPVFNKNYNHEFSKKNLEGFIYAPFTYSQFFTNIWEDFEEAFEYQVFELDQDDKKRLLFEQLGIKSKDNIIEKRINLFGQDLVFRFYPKNNLKAVFNISFLILVISLGITLLIIKLLNDSIKKAEQSSINESYLKESLRLRDEFISIASHELKTPLTALKLRAQISKRKLSKDNVTIEGIKDFAEEIEKQVIRLERLVNDILDITRIRTGNFSFKPEEFNFCDLVDDVISRLKQQFYPSTPPLISKPCNEIMVNWDRMRMEQVLNNILTNAIKYGQGSPIKIDIELKNNEVIFSISDKGIGIDPAFKDTIFNRFERAGISPNEVSGLGLGLFITYNIISIHKGRIWVESEKNLGSTFYVKIAQYPNF